MAPLGGDSDGVRVDVLVQPRASRVRIGPMQGDRLKIAVTSPPVDGAANKAVIAALAKALCVPRRNVSITHGHSGRRKTVRILGVDRAAIARLLG